MACVWAQEGTAGSKGVSEVGPGKTSAPAPEAPGLMLTLRCPLTGNRAGELRGEHVPSGLGHPWIEEMGLGPFLCFPSDSVPIPLTLGRAPAQLEGSRHVGRIRAARRYPGSSLAGSTVGMHGPRP